MNRVDTRGTVRPEQVTRILAAERAFLDACGTRTARAAVAADPVARRADVVLTGVIRNSSPAEVLAAANQLNREQDAREQDSQ